MPLQKLRFNCWAQSHRTGPWIEWKRIDCYKSQSTPLLKIFSFLMSSTEDKISDVSVLFRGMHCNLLGRSTQNICRITKARFFMCSVTPFITLKFSNCILVFSHLNFIPTLFYLNLNATNLRNCNICLTWRLCSSTRACFHIKIEAFLSYHLPSRPYLFSSVMNIRGLPVPVTHHPLTVKTNEHQESNF